ncbi:MAG TPA: alpha-amylase family protein [Pirellulaceae bacterium]|jgi:maltose alpha-D-glucosyltransferase/alpha-amylase|nr:alpha-amylase family protein [Pirellulaceae bacterium]
MPIHDLWYKNAIVYCLDVETFQDSDGDGIGDFHGLSDRLDYLSGLGVTCLWLMPFFPTPNRDDGYDVMDYYAVDPRLGSLGEFVEFIRQARERGIRVLIDLVVNHTSTKHPWFQAARSDPDSPFRDFYVWAKERPKDHKEGIIFPGFQETTWTWDEKAQAYYFHRFYEQQADLNIANPRVREEIRRIMGFWLELGVAGFRIDAAPFLIEMQAVKTEHSSDPFEYLQEFRDYLTYVRGDAVLLAEANVDMKTAPKYLGGGDRMQLLFNFLVQEHLMLSLVREKAEPIARGLRALPDIPPQGQWANFLRNHDEMSLWHLSKKEQEEIYQALGPEETMRIYDRGIRRRLPPMFEGDVRRVKLSHSLLLTLPGTPVFRYGEEIGMGDDLSLPERLSIRTPMQWSSESNAGFSTAPAEKLIRPVIDEGEFAYEQVNVERQQQDDRSLLTITERMIRVRRSCPEFGWGECEVVSTGDDAVLALRATWKGKTVFAVQNLASDARTATVKDFICDGVCVDEVVSDQVYDPVDKSTGQVALAPYGFRWFRKKA